MTYLPGVRVNRGAVVAAADVNSSSDTNSEKASMFNDNIGVSFAASIFNENALTVTEAASIFMNTNLSISRIDAILNNVNLSDSKASQIIYETDVATRDLSACSNVIGTAEIVDDWQDNKLTSRDSEATTPILIPSPFVQDTTVFRPEWTIVAGTPSVGSGVLTLPANAQVSISSTFNVGTWECLMVAAGGGTHYFLLQSGGVDKYECKRQDDASIGLFDCVDGVWIIGPNACQDETIASIIKMTRDDSSGWEIFEGGVSKGTVTDSTTTSFDELHLCTLNQSSNFDNLKVY